MADQHGAQTEVEWQFNAVDVRPVARWLEGDGVEGYTVQPSTTKQLHDTYFDTEDWRVHRAGFTCRLRWDGHGGELTVKEMAEAEAGIRRRQEINQPVLNREPEQFLREDGPATEMLRPLVGRRPLETLFVLDTERRRYVLADDNGEIGEVALDTTSIPVGSEDHPVRLSRVEVEVRHDAVDRAQRFVDELMAATSLTRAGTSKFEAALLATDRRPVPSARDLGPTRIEPAMTAAELAFAVMRGQYAALVTNEAGTRLGMDPEALHDMRVATRRMRAALSTFRPFLSPTATVLAREIGWLTRVLAPVRDLDVQLARLDDWTGQNPQWSEALAPYRAGLLDQRKGARKRMLAALDSRRYERLVARIEATLRTGPARTFAPGRVPVLAAAPAVVERRYRKLRKQGDAIAPGSPAADYHQARIQGKKLRYAVEFVAEIYGKRAASFVEAVKALQDVLGDHQDAEVAQATLREQAASGRRLPAETLLAMGAFAEHYRLEAVRLREAFPRVYRPLRGKTWRRLQAKLRASAPASNTGGHVVDIMRKQEEGSGRPAKPIDRRSGAG